MSLELTLLIAFVGLVTIRAILGDSGPISAFKKAGPRLGARIEVQMTTGRCFSVPRGASSIPCQSVISWNKKS